MSKQTAVEWFFQQLTTVDYNCINKTFLQNDNSLSGHNIRKLFQEAKEMEEQQIINAFDAGHRSGSWNFLGDEYYEKTFKKENNVR